MNISASDHERPRSAGTVRINALFLALGCAGVLAMSIALSPDPRGFGTHEQLGLPPCISTNFIGVPCPLCGMTTSFSLMAHARPVEAFNAQPAGVVFFVICALALAGALTAAILGFTPRWVGYLVRAKWIGSVTIALMLGAWAYKLVSYVR